MSVTSAGFRPARPAATATSIAAISRERLKVLGEAQLLRANAWTVPTLFESRLFVRDRHELEVSLFRPPTPDQSQLTLGF